MFFWLALGALLQCAWIRSVCRGRQLLHKLYREHCWCTLKVLLLLLLLFEPLQFCTLKALFDASQTAVLLLVRGYTQTLRSQLPTKCSLQCSCTVSVGSCTCFRIVLLMVLWLGSTRCSYPYALMVMFWLLHICEVQKRIHVSRVSWRDIFRCQLRGLFSNA